MNPKLSLLITYYNEGEMLTECVDSLLAATMLPDEILIYDDCSPRPAADFVAPHPNIRIIRGETNRGASYARDFLLREARGEYVHYHDADDLFTPDWCEEIMRVIENNPSVDLIINNWQWHTLAGEGTIVKISQKNNKTTFEKSDSDAVRHFIRHGANTQSVTFRRSIAIDMGGYKIHGVTIGEDRYFNIQIALRAVTVHLMEIPIIIIRERVNSASRDRGGKFRTLKQAQDRQIIYPLLIKDLPNKYHLELASKAFSESIIYLRDGINSEGQKTFQFAYDIAGDRLFADYPTYRKILIKLFGFVRTLYITDKMRRAKQSISRRIKKN